MYGFSPCRIINITLGFSCRTCGDVDISSTLARFDRSILDEHDSCISRSSSEIQARICFEEVFQVKSLNIVVDRHARICHMDICRNRFVFPNNQHVLFKRNSYLWYGLNDCSVINFLGTLLYKEHHTMIFDLIIILS